MLPPSASSRFWVIATVVAHTSRLPFRSLKLSRYSLRRFSLKSRLKPREAIRKIQAYGAELAKA